VLGNASAEQKCSRELLAADQEQGYMECGLAAVLIAEVVDYGRLYVSSARGEPRVSASRTDTERGKWKTLA